MLALLAIAFLPNCVTPGTVPGEFIVSCEPFKLGMGNDEVLQQFKDAQSTAAFSNNLHLDNNIYCEGCWRCGAVTAFIAYCGPYLNHALVRVCPSCYICLGKPQSLIPYNDLPSDTREFQLRFALDELRLNAHMKISINLMKQYPRAVQLTDAAIIKDNHVLKEFTSAAFIRIAITSAFFNPKHSIAAMKHILTNPADLQVTTTLTEMFFKIDRNNFISANDGQINPSFKYKINQFADYIFSNIDKIYLQLPMEFIPYEYASQWHELIRAMRSGCPDCIDNPGLLWENLSPDEQSSFTGSVLFMYGNEDWGTGLHFDWAWAKNMGFSVGEDFGIGTIIAYWLLFIPTIAAMERLGRILKVTVTFSAGLKTSTKTAEF